MHSLFRYKRNSVHRPLLNKRQIVIDFPLISFSIGQYGILSFQTAQHHKRIRFALKQCYSKSPKQPIKEGKCRSRTYPAHATCKKECTYRAVGLVCMVTMDFNRLVKEQSLNKNCRFGTYGNEDASSLRLSAISGLPDNGLKSVVTT